MDFEQTSLPQCLKSIGIEGKTKNFMLLDFDKRLRITPYKETNRRTEEEKQWGFR